jgi:3-methylfumaryl-CoA hydratase
MASITDRPAAELISEDWSAWVGNMEQTADVVLSKQVVALGATLDLDGPFEDGAELPPGWHWLFFNPFVRRRVLGSDGHPQRGGFLPPVPLPRRMWAGGRITYSAPLLIGDRAVRTSEITKIEDKSGKRGPLVFVTVRHMIVSKNVTCLTEEQDIVYRGAPAPGGADARPQPAPQGAVFRSEIKPDPVLLFRYSALTSNGHRIHYDQPYVRNEEGYRDLVVHGPLVATLLQDFAVRCGQPRRLTRFNFRGVAPLFVDRPFSLEARNIDEDAKLDLWACGPDGELAMLADATFG